MDTLARLWVKLTAFYGKLFTNRFGQADDTGIWFEALNNLSEREIDYAVSLIIKGQTNGEYDKFPPNPAQFRQLCLTDKTHNLPNVGYAFDEANRNLSSGINKWSHPFIKLAAQRVGRLKFQQLQTHLVYREFISEYESVCKQARLSHIPTKTIRLDDSKACVDSLAATKHLTPLLRSIR